ncbi:MAG: MarR family transcriptional regulator [Maribacter sp.]|nr:MAG: MarR family transcriptional regulator [Maribacter sp.]
MKSKGYKTDFENSLIPWLGKTVKMVGYYLQEVFDSENLDLTKEQMIVLKKLHVKDGLNQNKLATLTYRDKSSLARLLSKMETKNYIVRRQNNDDKRINDIFLTEVGRSIFKRSKVVVESLVAILEKDISEEEKQGVIQILKKVQFNLAIRREVL